MSAGAPGTCWKSAARPDSPDRSRSCAARAPGLPRSAARCGHRLGRAPPAPGSLRMVAPPGPARGRPPPGPARTAAAPGWSKSRRRTPLASGGVLVLGLLAMSRGRLAQGGAATLRRCRGRRRRLDPAARIGRDLAGDGGDHGARDRLVARRRTLAGWMRPVFALTDWLILPIARRLPPMGAGPESLRRVPGAPAPSSVRRGPIS
jgi:hypothetical protein